MTEDIQVDREKTGERTCLRVRNGYGKGAGHAAGNEWMVGGRKATRTTEER
jgi:hypothetical protein